MGEDQKEINNKKYREPSCKGPREQSNGLGVPVVSKNKHGMSKNDKNGKSSCSRNGLSITSDENKSCKPQKEESKSTNDKKLKEPKETKILERKLSVEPKSPSEHSKVKTQDNTEPEKPKALIAPNDNTLTQ